MEVLHYLRPLLFWMRALGIEMDPFIISQKNHLYRFLILALSTILLLINLGSHILYGVELSLKSPPASAISRFITNKNSTPLLLQPSNSNHFNKGSLLIDAFDSALLAIGVHAALFLISFRGEWASILDHLHRLLNKNPEFESLKPLFKKASYQALFFLLMETFVLFGLIAIDISRKNNTVLNGLTTFFINITQLYSLTGLVFFVTLLRMILFSFESLREKLEKLLHRFHKEDGIIISQSLIKWKRLHFSLCDAVERINNCFGPVIFFWIFHIFVNFISLSFYLFQGFQSSNRNGTLLVKNGVLMIQLSVQVVMITVVPSQLFQEVAAIGRMLRKVVVYSNNELQDQVNFVTSEVLVSMPKISAMDYCDVNLSLIPTLIGTTLTYLIILYQFQFSEKNFPS